MLFDLCATQIEHPVHIVIVIIPPSFTAWLVSTRTWSSQPSHHHPSRLLLLSVLTSLICHHYGPWFVNMCGVVHRSRCCPALGAAPRCCPIADESEPTNHVYHHTTHNTYRIILSYIWFATKENKLDLKKKKKKKSSRCWPCQWCRRGPCQGKIPIKLRLMLYQFWGQLCTAIGR